MLANNWEFSALANDNPAMLLRWGKPYLEPCRVQLFLDLRSADLRKSPATLHRYSGLTAID